MAFLVPLGLAVGAVGAAGAISSANATAANYSYQAEIARNNAQIAEQNAAYAGEAGEEQATRKSLQGAAQFGRIRAAQAASGIDVNTGSAVDVQESERETNKLDTETTLNNALLQAYGFRTNAANYTAQAGAYEAGAEEAPIAGAFQAAGTLLGAASSFGGGGSGSPGGFSLNPGGANGSGFGVGIGFGGS